MLDGDKAERFLAKFGQSVRGLSQRCEDPSVCVVVCVTENERKRKGAGERQKGVSVRYSAVFCWIYSLKCVFFTLFADDVFVVRLFSNVA